jgi:hypothetical protein
MLPCLVLTSMLAPCLGCDDEPACPGCDDPLELAGTATFDGESHAFDDGVGIIYMAGTAANPCIDLVLVGGRSDSAAFDVYLAPPEGGGPLEVTSVGFGGAYSPEDYGLYNEDITNFDGTFELEGNDEDSASASLTVTGGGRMYLSASEDFGPYMLTDVDVSVTGGWTIEWVEACD